MFLLWNIKYHWVDRCKYTEPIVFMPLNYVARWKSRYDNGDARVKETIDIFAVEKLLCRTYGAGNMATSWEQQFAVMSHRLVLAFDTPSCSGLDRRNAERSQMVQVEKYMRVCLHAKQGFESIVTVAASEPILAEAAAIVMQHKEFRSCRSLREILVSPGMSKGDRGELIVSNITIDTLDGLAFRNPKKPSFVVKTTSYFEALFAQNIYNDVIRDAQPSRLRSDSELKTFAQTFEDSYIYVTHFIKVYDYSVLTDSFIMVFAVRGAAILCAENQAGIDAIIPVVYKDKVLNRMNMTVILKQSKNNSKFSTIPHGYLFDLMNPFTLGIFNKHEPPRPVIRMVYALAAHSPVIRVMQRGNPPPKRSSKDEAKGESQSSKRNFTSFDIWCGHTSSATFGAICLEDNLTYEALLKRSREVVDMFQPEHECVEDTMLSMYPGGTSKGAHWESFIDFTDVPNTASFEDKVASEESDIDDESEPHTGSFTIVPVISLSLCVYTGRHTLEPAGLPNCLKPKF